MIRTIARVEPISGTVLAIQCADQEWIDRHADDPTVVPFCVDSPSTMRLHRADLSAPA